MVQQLFFSFNEKHWYKDGKLHRIDGPAKIWVDGSEFWYQHDKLHRLGGPAVINENGREEWFKNGKRHRNDGPAVINENGREEWWVDDAEYVSKIHVNWAVVGLGELMK